MLCAIVVSVHVSFAQSAAQPHYKVDPFWPKELPHQWIIGQIGGMAVDQHNHILGPAASAQQYAG